MAQIDKIDKPFSWAQQCVTTLAKPHWLISVNPWTLRPRSTSGYFNSLGNPLDNFSGLVWRSRFEAEFVPVKMPATLITIKVREEVATVKVVPFEGWQISKHWWNWMTHVQKSRIHNGNSSEVLSLRSLIQLNNLINVSHFCLDGIGDKRPPLLRCPVLPGS